MKKLAQLYLGIAMLNCTITNAQQKPRLVSISGTLSHFTNEVLVEDMSEFQYLLPPDATRLIHAGDSLGTFQIQFPLAAPNYFRIGRNALYLSPGDDLKVFIDYNNPLLAKFSGRGSAANLFLCSNPFPKGGSFIEAGSKAQTSPQQTIDYLVQAAASRKNKLDSLKHISNEFKHLETGRVNADLINSLRSGEISFYRPRAIQKDTVKMKQYQDEYSALIKPLLSQYTTNFTDAALLKLVVYRDIADLLLTETGTAADKQQINDWFKATAIIDSMKTISDKKELENFKSLIADIKTRDYRNAVNVSLASLMQFGKGDAAADFTATDINGNNISLSGLKGKLIYIDIWATWCGPCMAEMPNYEILKKQYSNNPNIVFISLSIDDNQKLWKENVNSRKADGYQWLVNRNALAAYNIVGIPRALLIDSNFNMVNMNAGLPSSKKIIQQIDGLLK